MNTGPLIHLGFCWVFGAEDPLLALERLRACGFEGIELWPRDLRRHGPAKWAAALAATGMRCFQLCPYFNFVHGAEKQRESRAILDEFLSAAQVLACTRLRAFTGPPWGEGVVGAAAATEEQWQSSISGLCEYCDVAGPDVEICLECHAGSLMENSAGALRILREVQRPNLTVNLQLPLLGEEVATSITALGRYTTHIHIHNWAAGFGIATYTYLSAPGCDWYPLLGDLVHRQGRSLCLSVEHADHGEGPWKTAELDGPYLVELRRRVLGAGRPETNLIHTR